MTEKAKVPRAAALAVANELLTILAPACTRIEIVGSLRRGKESVGDVELLYVPRTEIRPIDMFAVAPVNLADEAIAELLANGTLAKRLSKTGVANFGPLNKLLVHVASGIPVDLFQTESQKWWVSLVIRTGSKETNLKLTKGAQKLGRSLNAYGSGVTDNFDGTVTAAMSEEDVFRLCGVPFLLPMDR